MRASLGPIAINLLFLFAGAGICVAAGAVAAAGRSWIAAAGLSYMAGVAATNLVLIALLVLGVPFTLETVVVTSAALGAGGFGYARYRRLPVFARPREARRLRRRLTEAPLDSSIVAVFVLVFLIYGTVGLLTSVVTPLDQWDGWSLWTRKALLLTHFDEIPLASVSSAKASEFFGSGAYEFMHPDYPLIVPVLEAGFFRAAGEINTQAVHVQLWLLLVGFAWACAGIMSRTARPIVWAPVVLAAIQLSGTRDQLLTGYADVPMGIFLGLGVLLLGGWIRERERWQLVLAALMLGAAANVKNEGLMASVCVLAVATGVPLARRSWRDAISLLGVWAGLIAAVAPWRVWLAVHDISGDFPVAKGLSPGYLADRSERVGPSIDALTTQLLDQDQWMHLVPLALGVAVLAVLHRSARAVASFYLAAGVFTFGGLVWAYWVGPDALAYLLPTSADRVVVVIVFIAIAALLQIGAALDSRSPRGEQVS